MTINTPHDQAIRRDERLRLAELFEEYVDTLGTFTQSGKELVRLLAFMLRLDNPEVPLRHAWGGGLIDLDRLHDDDPPWRVECSGCGWHIEAPRSEAVAAGRAHEDENNPVSIRGRGPNA